MRNALRMPVTHLTEDSPTELRLRESLKKVGLQNTSVERVSTTSGGAYWTLKISKNGLTFVDIIGAIRKADLDLRAISTMHGAFSATFWEPFGEGIRREN